ncbi:MAG: PQQ-binding-like beta-propeller repeat protein [Gammaproteobacteria bacterium]|nr:PQQ-binding-like beta-propeller repeat protein [Gammaproteobacteria bacterium]
MISRAFMLAVTPAFFLTSTSASSSPRIVNSWLTGNSLLYPFTLTGKHLYLNGDTTVEVIDISEGKTLWTNQLDTPAVFRPRVVENLVISAGRKQLVAWDRQGGSKSWYYSGKNELGVPLTYQGRIHLGDGHNLIALDAKSGQNLWSFATNSSARIAYAPVGNGEVVYLGAGDGVLYALSSESGRLIWKVDREKDWQYLRQLGVSGDVLVAGGYHDEIFGIDIKSGQIRWRFNAGNFINSQLVTPEAVYFWSPTGWVYALEALSGKVLWRHQTINYKSIESKQNWAPVMAEIILENNLLYVLAMDNVLHILDTESGEQVNQYTMPVAARPFITLELATNRILIGSKSGKVFYLELT